ncbi:PfkB family carbohydrate kinase [Spirosoma sp. RP8]|uniref:PfkB family carbohydrate kinase n=1 Tax=Spirosoma liriopis TaxID=2937440 RepID=A0ABT0HS15_9BACT|nr:PfkB family carbohydrate kinase [Spirosoma liriopis]MCK8494973.1 PfkB family carbohydrate kinase [Spirosoma liriopis]
MFDICTIGHISLDKVVTAQSVTHMPGGTSFYFSKSLLQFDVNYCLVTAVAPQEQPIVDSLRAEGIDVYSLPSENTVFFENIYSEDQNYRQQQVLRKASPFDVALMPTISAKVFHLGPLLYDDIPVALIKELAQRGQVSLDVQGYLRDVRAKKVIYQDWIDKKQILPYVSILKANEFEMEVITGKKNARDGANYLADLGVSEVIITLGSEGSLVYTGGTFYKIPAFRPTAVIDATGCGDTYMAGYLWKKTKGASIQEAGEFGAAMATLKIGSSGPFTGHPDQVTQVMEQALYDHARIAVS